MGSTIRNFGGNIRFQPAELRRPASENDLMEILRGAGGRRIRVMGRLHSWSDAVVTRDLLLDLSQFNSVELIERDGKTFARVGAGTQVKQVLSELRRLGDWTLPSQGLIDEQSIAGAIATATHGSGKSSLSHYVRAMRVVQFDSDGKPQVRTIDSGDELLAARCSLGCMGIVVSLDLEIRPAYLIEEQFRQYRTLADALACEQEYPLQQLFLIPWHWEYFGQHRREVSDPCAQTRFARRFGMYFHVVFDIGMHLAVLALVRIAQSRRVLKFFYRRVMLLFLIRNWRVVDRSDRILTMQHELFRHIETEMFVRQNELDGMLRFVKWLMQLSSGENATIPEDLKDRWAQVAGNGELESLRGKYTHHYPICIRKVLPDETLISTTAGWDETGYAVSLICYLPPDSRDGFFRFARLLARSSIRMFGARAHWGKFNDIATHDLLANCENWSRFVAQIERADPAGVFRNEWIDRLLEHDC